MPITLLIWLFARTGLPQRLLRPLAWATVVIAVIALLWLAKTMYDRSVIQGHEQERETKAVEARDRSAEERADDAVRNIIDQQERDAAIAEAALKEAQKPESERAKLPPTTIAANCTRLRKAYSAAELARLEAYRELCK